MKKIRVGINGFGRIGRMVARIVIDHPRLELVAVNDLFDAATMAHLFRYDSIHGRFKGEVSGAEGKLIFNGKPVVYTSVRDVADLNWNDPKVDVLIESTGMCKTYSDCEHHLSAGATRVLLSAPPSDDSVKTIVAGVNDGLLLKSDKVISNASCTTHSAAPMIYLLDQLCEIEYCYITTVHSYTGDQKLHDAPHRDWRRGRAAAESIVPTTTGAAKALTRIFPQLHDSMGGCGIRVPVPDGSLTDITCTVKHPKSIEKINQYFEEAARGQWKNILEYTEDPIVSRDIIGNTHSCVFDAQLTSVIGDMVKVVGWYDNEIGYSNRLVELAERMD